MNLDSLDEILRFAIRKEADAAAFYKMAADHSNPGVKKAFKELAEIEEGHKKKLEKINLKKVGEIKLKKPRGLGISETLEDAPYSPDMSYSDLLRMAIKNEEKSHRLYLSAEKMVTDSNLKKLLLKLAQEESAHKEKLEKIYDEEILEWF